MGLVSELRRRNVLRMAVLYAVAAWLIMQVAEVVIGLANLPSWIGPTILGLLAVGFPIALIFSWFYELTPEGLSLEKDVAQGESITHVTGRRMDFVVISLLCAAVILFAYDKWWPHGPPEQSIAVLPFENMSDNSDDDYFADGIAEELLNELANLNSLHVAAKTSSYFFKGKNEPVQSIGRQLGVRTVLEGSVRKSGNRVRITAQLVNAASGYQLWAETYDRELGDVFAIQEEIARAITIALNVKILGHESSRLTRNPTDDIGVYDYYLLGQHYRERRNPESLEKSIELFTQAIEIDDQFALGYSALAQSYLLQAYYSDLSPERVDELTMPLIRKSLKLDPNLAKTHSTQASVRLLLNDFSAADAGFRRALELQPNYASAWSNLGFSMVRQSRLKEAAAAYEKAKALDPLNAALKFNNGALMMLIGRYEDGLEAFQKVIELAPKRSGTEATIIYWSIAYGRYEEAARWVNRLQAKEPHSARAADALARTYSNLGIWDKSWEAIHRAHEMAPDNGVLLTRIGRFFLYTGDLAGLISFATEEYDKIDKSKPSRYSPTDQSRYFWHGMAALLQSDYMRADADLTKAAGGKDGIANAVYDGITALKYVSYAYQKQGRNDAADALLNQCLDLAKQALDQGWDTPSIHYRTAQIYALIGDSDSAIAELNEAVDRGWRKAGRLERDPLWSSLQDDVRFQSIVTKVNNDITSQREHIMLLWDGLQSIGYSHTSSPASGGKPAFLVRYNTKLIPS